jgi:serine/threonine-protein kinase
MLSYTRGQVPPAEPAAEHAAAAPARPEPPREAQQPATVEVPDLKGLSPDQARLLLKDRGLLLVLDREEASDTAAKGTVAAQMPMSASTVRAGSEVHAVVSSGKRSVAVPDLKARTVADAQAALAAAGLRAGSVERKSDPAAPETVLASVPPAGTEVEAGTPVSLVASAGPGLVEVPRVTGGGMSRARKLLEEKGFVAGKAHYVYNEDYSPGTVYRQVPAAGERAAPGSTVGLYVVSED